MGDHKRKNPNSEINPEHCVDDTSRNKKRRTKNPWAGFIDKKLNGNSARNPGVSSGDGTVAPVDPQTPPNKKIDKSQLQTPSSITSNGSSISDGDVAESRVTVDHDVGNGEYVLKIKMRSISNSTYENKKEEAKQLAQDAGMMFLQAEMLRNMGEQLLAKYRASLQCIFEKSVPRIDLPDQ